MVGCLTMHFTRQGSALEINHSTMEVVGVKDVMETKSKVDRGTEIGLKLIFLVLLANLGLVKISGNKDREQTSVMKHMRRQDYSLIYIEDITA